jgi:hypothetical protein
MDRDMRVNDGRYESMLLVTIIAVVGGGSGHRGMAVLFGPDYREAVRF